LAGATVFAVALTHALLILGVGFAGSREEMLMTIFTAATVVGLAIGTIVADVVIWATDRRRADPDHADDIVGNPDPPSPIVHRE
jgi:cation transporter-like permease